ncbi:hypothetical protein BGZ60DRAFT_414137 [Tricladium varicosporioides]|nr:hypothetical protein BGZ60DRAFT_414137 [Hymenoscyphus varicosporioides]
MRFSAVTFIILPVAVLASHSCKINFHGKDKVYCHRYPSQDSKNHYTFDNDKADDLKADTYKCWAQGQSRSGYDSWQFNSDKGCWVSGYDTDDNCGKGIESSHLYR